MLLAGKAGRRARQTGVTLIEMMIVMMLVSLMVGITFPAVTSGLDSLRLNSAADSVAGALNMALNRADRRQTAVEVLIEGPRNRIVLASAEPGFQRVIELPDGVRILTILPEYPMAENTLRQFLVFPGGTVPRIGVVLLNRRGATRTVSVDPITGAPRIVPGSAP
jgi:prepilin-type N-terminal cleavage/methylation domain-containing protein